MTDKQPEALEMATELEEDGRWRHANLIRAQHAAIERKDALLRQALDALCLPCDCSSLELSKPVGDAVDAIIKELSQ